MKYRLKPIVLQIQLLLFNMYHNYWLFLFLLFFTMFFIVKKKKLTSGAAIVAAAIGCCIFLGTGFTGVAMIGLFFLLGTLATSFKISVKEKLGAAEINKGKRNAGQVIANGGVAAIAGILACFFTMQEELFALMMAGALSAATADTLSSELGTLYGKQFYNILNFKKDTRGENGVVSLEGTVIGFAGSAMIATIFSVGYGWDYRFFGVIIAGTIGNYTDSLLGATLERKQLLKNDVVNFINTLAGTLAAYIFMKIS
jgi:uncharacterized protein (TIGR00297 family)